MVVPFPFTERVATKRRPALVLSRSEFNEGQGQLVLAMVTSTTARWSSDAPIADWREAGLTLACHVRMKLFTLDRSLIVSRLGALSHRDRQAVALSLTTVLALT